MKSQTGTMAPAVEARMASLGPHSPSDLASDLSTAPKHMPPESSEFSLAGQDGTVRKGGKDTRRPCLPDDGSPSSTILLPSLPSLPSLPVFDAASFDLDIKLSTSLHFHDSFEATLARVQRTTAVDKDLETNDTMTVTATTTITPAVPIDADKAGKSTRKRPSGASRRHSWLLSSTSAINVRDLGLTAKMRKHGCTDALVAKPESGRSAAKSVNLKPMERPRTMESFADFAKRSWRCRSPSPSPSPSAAPYGGSSNSSSSSSSSRHSMAYPGDDPRQPSRDRPATEPASGTTRALNRASVYLTRLKQRPHSVFSKPLSDHAAKPKLHSADATPGTIADQGATTATATATAETAAGGDLIAANSSPDPSTAAPSLNLNLHHRNRNNRNSSHTASSEASSTTGTAASENASQSTAETSVTMANPIMLRDPLWATFRTLEADFAKFATKTTTTARMTLVRTALVPFLRKTGGHPSNHSRKMVSPEDVERRATILNKWWHGLLAMLDGGNARHGLGILTTTDGFTSTATPLQPVAGVDRPTLLEVATMMMMRPEWRLCTTRHQPISDRHPTAGCDADVWANSEFLVESAEHNVRTMFQTNLLAQMAIAVEKMSQRHAPLSLVTWCGKACAYAFFFAPGIAHVLVRLWMLQPDLLRRVADECGLPRGNAGESHAIAGLFPGHVADLVWTSAKSLGDTLRTAAQLPMNTAKIPWHGPWVTRWRGGDTDLFFIFCKYYFILADEFMPTGLPSAEKARAPAFVLVQAQMLAVLDTTIHRQASIDAALLGPPLSDALHGVDATLTPITLPSNLLRDMNENRLVILLRDVLWEGNHVPPSVKHTFAQAFMTVMKAATKRTSRYEHGAHFVLCDFLEEALPALDVYQNAVAHVMAPSLPGDSDTGDEDPIDPVDYIDWPFWFDVGRMILDSNNTMSEIRLLSFLFSVWDAVASDEERKKAVCLGWLLTEVVFESFFNHWCPMVRAYYMRLLCWRVCRDTGRPSDVDTQIFLLVSHRLSTVWSHYLWSKQQAEENRRLPPSTAPCLPSPGRRFMIIKTEIQAPQPGLMLAFDRMSSSCPSREAMIAYNHSIAMHDETTSPSSKKAENGSSGYKRKWNLLGKVLSFSVTPSNAAAVGQTGAHRRVWEDELETARRETAASRSLKAIPPGSHHGSGPKTPTKPQQTYSPTGAPPPSSDSPSSTASSPLYEAAQLVFRFTLAGQPSNHHGMLAPRDRVLDQPMLPAPAQATVGSWNPMESLLATRRYSGSSQTGLVSEARDSPRLDVTPSLSAAMKHGGMGADREKDMSLGFTVRAVSEDDEFELGEKEHPLEAQQSDGTHAGLPQTQPVKPVGVYAAGAAYTGRALAEWALVVNECNNFVERRREEGVLGLRDMEVPSLGVEGMGMRARA